MYSVDSPSIETALSIGLESSERTTPPSSTKRDMTTLQEQFDIRTRGWAYDPELLNFAVSLQPEFEQSDEQWSSGLTEERNGTFLGFLVDANLLPYDRYSWNLRAERDRRDIATSRVISDSTTEFSLYRASLRAKHPLLPTTVMLESLERTNEQFFSTRTEQTDRLHARSRHTTPASRTFMETEIVERSVTAGSTDSMSDRVALRMDNQLQFWDRNRAVSHFRFADQTSATSSMTTTGLSSDVTMVHRDNLDTRYKLEYDDRKVQNFESTRNYVSAALRHQLYENLTTRLDAETDRREGTDADLDDSGAAANFAYTRPIPWGRLYLDLGHQRRITDYQRRLAFAQILNEQHRLVGGYENRVPLRRTDIDIDTVRVTDVDGNEYLRDLDYELEQDGDLVYIWRTLLGGIEDGEEVLVSYDYETDPSVEFTRATNLYGVAMDLWSTLKLYHHRSDSDVDVRSGIEPEGLVHSSELTGVELRWRWGSASSSTALEAEDIGTALVFSKFVRARQRLTVGSWSSTEIEAEEEKADETIEGVNGEADTLAHTRTKTLLARQLFYAGNWSTTDFEAEHRTVEGDITERTEVPATTLRLRQMLAYGGWSTTTLEAEDITFNGDPADFPPTRFRYDVTPATTLRIRQTLAFRLSSTLRTGLGASYFERERKDTGLRSEGGGYSATVNWNHSAVGRFSARAFYEESRSTQSSEERLGLDARHEWRYGAWYPSVRYALSDESRQPTGEMRKDTILYFELRRIFQ